MEGNTLLLTGSATFIGSLGANSLLLRIARRRGWYDRPDGWLKNHGRPVPLVGGIGVMLTLAMAAVLLAVMGQWTALGFAGAGILALLLGVWDDFHWKTAKQVVAEPPGISAESPTAPRGLFGLPVPIVKLGLQFSVALGAAAWLALAGIKILPAMPLIGLALAAMYILGAMNAINLEDGMDGLASGEALVSALGFAVLFSRAGQAGAAGMAVALAGALLGFLVLNWRPAQLFLGDGGSHLLGALLAALAVAMLGLHGLAAIPATVFIIGLPVFDTAWIIVRRALTGKRLVLGDRDHLYDVLHSSGMSVPETVVFCWLVQAIFVGTGVLWLSRIGR